MKHKQRKKVYIEKQLKKRKKHLSVRLNLQPSLTKSWLELLQYAKEKLTAVKEVRFPYADIHGNLKIVINTPMRNRYLIGFKTGWYWPNSCIPAYQRLWREIKWAILCSISNIINSSDFALKVNLPLRRRIKFKTKYVSVSLVCSYLEDGKHLL